MSAPSSFKEGDRVHVITRGVKGSLPLGTIVSVNRDYRHAYTVKFDGLTWCAYFAEDELCLALPEMLMEEYRNEQQQP